MDGTAPSDHVVPLWKLKKFEEEPPKWSDDPEEKAFGIVFNFGYSNTIVSEPDSDAITRQSYYLVRLKVSSFN